MGYKQELISAHTHLILVGSIMMMIMGVALWFFPRAEKDDKKYNPNLILVVYWLMTAATILRFISQVIGSFYFIEWIGTSIFIFSSLQVVALFLFFYSIWGRIRPVEASTERQKEKSFNGNGNNRRLY